MTTTEIIERLTEVDGVFEVYQVLSIFQFLRNAKNGNTQTVTVKILDAGQNIDPNFRYQCFATSDDGRTATGNPDSSIEDALTCMHWEHLDL
jgi:hypothetical protein